MKKFHRPMFRAAACLVLGVASLGALLLAQEPKQTPSKNAAPVQAAAATAPEKHGVELTAADLEAFLDGFMPQQIEKADIAGAVIAVVKDGKVVFEKGYGYSDSERKTPVSPQDTLFRPGSISKTFTWTAVM